MDSLKKDPSEIKDHLSAEVNARIPERQALVDDAINVFNEFTTLEDCADEYPDYQNELRRIAKNETKLSGLKDQLPAHLAHFKDMDVDTLFETINTLMDEPNYLSKPDDERRNLARLRSTAGEISRSQYTVDARFKRKSGALRIMAKTKQNLATPNPEQLEKVAKAYAEICDLLDGHTFEVREYMPGPHRSRANMIAHKVEEFNRNFQSRIVVRYFEEGRVLRSNEKVRILKSRMRSPIESHSNHGMTVRLLTELDGWQMDISYNEQYHEGVAKEKAERHAVSERSQRAEEAQEDTRNRVRSMYSDGSSSGRERA